MTFSIFVRLSPSAERCEWLPQPSVKREGELVTIEVPFWDDGKDYWLVLAHRRLGAHEQNFRELVQSKFFAHLPRGSRPTPHVRAEIASVEQLSPVVDETSCGDEGKRIVVRIPFKQAMHAYIYHDFSVPVCDGGFYWTVDVPSYLIDDDGKGSRGRQSARVKGIRKIAIGALGAVAIGVGSYLIGLLLGEPWSIVKWPLALALAYSLVGTLEAISGIQFMDLESKWGKLRGWQRGIVGTLVAIASAVVIGYVVALFTH